MIERQIDKAYQQRDQSRRALIAGLDDLYTTFARACGAADVIGTGPVWVIAVARPERPHHQPRTLDLPQANGAFGSAVADELRAGAGISPLELIRDQTTRRGLRMFFRSYRKGRSGPNSHQLAFVSARAEVHGDGCVALGFTRDGLLGQENSPGHIPVDDLETVGLDLFALLEHAQRVVGVTGDYTGRIGIEPTTQIFRHRDNSSPEHFQPFDEARRVTHYAPVDGPILSSHGKAAALDSWLDITRDAVHQTGTTSNLDSVTAADLLTDS